MEKSISFNEFQSVKSVAKAIDPIIRKRDSLKGKIESLIEEYKGYETQIKALESGIVQIIGFHVEDLVKKVIEPTGKTDPKTGKPLTTTKYVGTDIVTYDEQKKRYIITVPDAEPEFQPESADASEPSEEEGNVEEVSEVAAEPANEQEAGDQMPW